MATNKTVLQKWTTLEGSAARMVYQDQSGWLDIGDIRECKISVEVSSINSGSSLVIETAVSPDEPWFTVASSGTAGGFTILASSLNAIAPVNSGLATMLRWKVIGAGENWFVCFRITVEYQA
jgi:hypothetical protein